MNYEVGLSVEERVASLFQQDTLLPAQYFETFRRKFYLEPEKRLMLAILDDAPVFKSTSRPVIIAAKLCIGRPRNGFSTKATNLCFPLGTFVRP
jgi:hypothetical protein